MWFKKMNLEIGEMLQQLRALTPLPEDLDSIPSILTTCNSSTRRSDALFELLMALYPHGAYVRMQVKHPYTFKN